jgi:hypothetical protein
MSVDIVENISILKELEDDDKFLISNIFFEKIVPKLRRLDAKLGTINCEFAGKRYSNWNIRFKSAGSGFEIVDFEYDEEGVGLDLDL